MILIDTNILVAFYNIRDSCHAAAVGILENIDARKYGGAIISDYVFDEAVTVCALRVGKKSAIELGISLLESFSMVRISAPLFKRAWNIFGGDNALSFTDCTHCALIEEFNIDFLATFDKEFKKLKLVKIVDGKDE